MSTPPKMPFIPTQRLFELQAPAEKLKQCLDPARFRSLRLQGEGHADDAEAALREDLPDCQWVEINNRYAELASPALRRLCLTVDAGTGKTTALKQTAFLLSERSSHLVIRVSFTQLPVSVAGYFDTSVFSLVSRLQTMIPCSPDDRHQPDYRHLILSQIRRKRFTLLVDALDQTAQDDSVPLRAQALCDFLAQIPNASCVVTGRPYAIYERYWDVLFAPDGQPCCWKFLRIDEFTEDEVRQCLGDARFQRLKLVEAETLRIPRSLETVLEVPEDQLEDIYTASDIYARAVENMLQKAFKSEDFRGLGIRLRRKDAMKLFGLLAFEMTKRGNFDGIPKQDRLGADVFETFKEEVFEARKMQLNWSDPDAFENRLEALGRLNEFLDAAVLDHEGLTELFWRNRTLQAYFSAWWVTSRNLAPEDRDWLREHRIVTAEETTRGGLPAESLRELWKLAAEMPTWAEGVDPDHWAKAMSVLYEPSREQAGDAVRSTEFLWRSWPQILHLAGFELPRDWHEGHLEEQTLLAQREVRKLVETGQDDFSRLSPAQQAVFGFLAEYPRILRGDFGDEPQQIAEAFEAGFKPVPPQPDDSLEFWLSAEGNWGIGRERSPRRWKLKQRFLLAEFPVTRALYGLFDGAHDTRKFWFGAGSTYSPESGCPVTGIDWRDASVMSWWLHSRLPIEGEWEAACRGCPGCDAPATDYWFDGSAAELTAHAWVSKNSDNHTHPAGAAGHTNAYGLSDLLGNVWEWTATGWHDDAREGEQRQRVVWRRVLRGGSFFNDSSDARSAFRYWIIPAFLNHYLSLRVARALPENL